MILNGDENCKHVLKKEIVLIDCMIEDDSYSFSFKCRYSIEATCYALPMAFFHKLDAICLYVYTGCYKNGGSL